MEIRLHLAFRETAAVSLLNWLARENARQLRKDPSLPGLYESGVEYDRETDETWSDYINLIAQGWEDCDALAAARAGELLARGYRALGPKDGGYQLARARRLTSIPAEVFLRTRTEPKRPGLYHCLVRYPVGGRMYFDDPSARLGMLSRRLDAEEVQQRLHLQSHPQE